MWRALAGKALQPENNTEQHENEALKVLEAAYAAWQAVMGASLQREHHGLLRANSRRLERGPATAPRFVLCLAGAIGGFLLGAETVAADQSDIIARVRERGHVVCGTATDELGFSSMSSDGRWSGLYIDLCRAVAIATLGDDKAIKFVPLVGTQRFRALAEGKVDLLARNTAWTASRDLRDDIRFAGTFFYDGKSFLIRKSSGVLSALELSGVEACLIEGGLTHASVANYFSERGMKFHAKTSETWTEVLDNYRNRACLVLAADTVQLAILRNTLDDKEEHSLLPEVFDIDAFGPYVPGFDERWRKSISWIMRALVMAEAQSISRDNVDRFKASQSSKVRSFFAIAEAAGKQFGFVDGWFQKVVEQVGHYGEMFERNLGVGSAVGLARGVNRPAAKGGLLRAPALR